MNVKVLSARWPMRSMMSIATLCALCYAPAAAAQGSPKQSGRVKLLKLDRQGADDKVVTLTETTLESALKSMPGMQWTPRGQVGLNELYITIGCSDLGIVCRKRLQAVLKTDILVFGSVLSSGKLHTLRYAAVDLRTGAYAFKTVGLDVKGQGPELDWKVPAAIDGHLFGDVGSMQVTLEGGMRGQVMLDKTILGVGSNTYDKLPLGKHDVQIVLKDGRRLPPKAVMLRRGVTSRVVFKAPTLIASKDGGGRHGRGDEQRGGDEPEPINIKRRGGNAQAIAGWVGVGAGVLLVGVGAWQHVQLGGLEDDAATRYGGRRGVTLDEATDVRQRQDEMDATVTRRNLFMGLGAVGLITGATLLLTSGSSESAPAALGGDGWHVDVRPQAGGAGVSVGGVW